MSNLIKPLTSVIFAFTLLLSPWLWAHPGHIHLGDHNNLFSSFSQATQIISYLALVTVICFIAVWLKHKIHLLRRISLIAFIALAVATSYISMYSLNEKEKAIQTLALYSN